MEAPIKAPKKVGQFAPSKDEVKDLLAAYKNRRQKK